MDYRKVAMLIIKTAIVFAIFIFILFVAKTTEINFRRPIDTKIFSDYGILVGSLASAALSIASIFLIIQTINETRLNATKQQIESRFFELVKIHRENRNEIISPANGFGISFEELVDEFEEIYRLVDAANSIRVQKLEEIDIINVAYLCFYFGVFDSTIVGNYSLQLISKVLRKYLNSEDDTFTSKLLNLCAEHRERIIKSGKFKYEIFTGHQSILGHYFRHIFQSVKFIDQQPRNILDYHGKYDYINVLRAQLSTEEQILFCFNSLSDLGRAWEMGIVDNNRKLITKYNLIKNIPIGVNMSYFDIKKYYPLVSFEMDGIKPKERIELESFYS